MQPGERERFGERVERGAHGCERGSRLGDMGEARGKSEARAERASRPGEHGIEGRRLRRDELFGRARRDSRRGRLPA